MQTQEAVYNISPVSGGLDQFTHRQKHNELRTTSDQQSENARGRRQKTGGQTGSSKPGLRVYV